MTTTEQTWTFCGHWAGDRLVVEYALPGIEQDHREDLGYWPEGLWAAAGSGVTIEEAERAAVEEYEHEYHDEPDPACGACKEVA